MLPCLPQGAVGVELGEHGVEHRRGDHYDEKSTEHPVLHVGGRVAQVPEGEAVEDADDDGGEEAPVDVRRAAPLADEHALGQEDGLGGDWRGELVGVGCRVLGGGSTSRRSRRGLGTVSLELLDLGQDRLVLGRRPPLGRPVDAGAVGAAAPLDGRLEEELGDVAARRAVHATVALSNNVSHYDPVWATGSFVSGVTGAKRLLRQPKRGIKDRD